MVSSILALFLCVPALARQQEPGRQRDERDRLQEKKLAERLKRNTSNASEGDVMEALIELMKSAARRLEVAFDAGAQTQAMQQQIMDRLDEAIKIAADRRRRSRSSQPRSQSDKRKMQRKQASRSSDSDDTSGAAGKGSSADALENGVADRPADAAGAGEFDTRRGWGQLPARERDEVIQGFQEKHLERFRLWIERYYRALQEADQ